MPTAYIAIGSNLGDKQKNCERAIEEILHFVQDDTTPYISVLRTSPWYHTKAVTLDGTPQPDYCNGVIEISTTLSPKNLLERCQMIERALGRVRSGKKWGPRMIDLDILLYDDLILNDPLLMIPHPEMAKRLFVLQPLCDIAPDVRHPLLARTTRELLETCRTTGDAAYLTRWKEH